MNKLLCKVFLLWILVMSVSCPVFAQHHWVYTDTDQTYYVDDSSIREGHSGYDVDIISTGRNGGTYSHREHRTYYYRYEKEQWYSYLKGKPMSDRPVSSQDEYIKRAHDFCLRWIRNR